ncbi:hypothetical protein SAMN05216238_10327 [Lentibacillus persicus]|uniref:Transcriptional regulator n=1 Tax=Lentibacillus persicus TaxID=640948 RepID=A0A1I1U4Z7_9BACI|nr:hypothetical protein SAMN05216238_10327 [Lentibacillus persicus]
MNVKIAVFGREDTIHQIGALDGEIPETEIFLFACSTAEETANQVEKAVMCDIYLFAGALPYLHAKDLLEKKRLPAVQVPIDEYMILTSLYHVSKKGQEIDRLSLDVPDSRQVSEVLHEISTQYNHIYTYSYGEFKAEGTEHIADHHQKLYEAGDIRLVLTTLEEVADILNNRNIPVACMKIPKRNLLKAIEKAKSIATINHSTSAQIVTGYASIKNIHRLRSVYGETYIHELQQKLQQILRDYAKKTQASVFLNSENQFVLFGTRTMLDHITSHYRDFPLLKRMNEELSVPADIGFGLGLSAEQSELNARLALDTSTEKDNGTCYIVNERRDLIGPLGIRKDFNPSKLYRSLIHEAKLNNELSYNFIDFIEVRNNEPFSSNDIANHYGVTKRSAERTIKKLIAGNVIKASGEEKPYVKGRPRKLFKLNQ